MIRAILSTVGLIVFFYQLSPALDAEARAILSITLFVLGVAVGARQ